MELLEIAIVGAVLGFTARNMITVIRQSKTDNVNRKPTKGLLFTNVVLLMTTYFYIT